MNDVEIGPRVPGAARLQLADGIPLLRPEEQVFTAMLEGWRHQQLARNLSLATVAARERAVRASTVHADTFPWLWTAAMLDEWLGDPGSGRRREFHPPAPTDPVMLIFR